MKILLKIVGAVLVCLVLLLVVLRITGFSPIGNTPGPGNYPGLWLKGEVVTTPITDWSFANDYPTDKLETRTWYLIPHSVTTGFIVYHGQLYITSRFAKGKTFPQGKSWTTNVMRDPHVRLKFGDKLYNCTLSVVTDPAEVNAVLAVRANGNSQPSGPNAADGSVMHLFHAQSD
jgi:hypothetical protein